MPDPSLALGYPLIQDAPTRIARWKVFTLASVLTALGGTVLLSLVMRPGGGDGHHLAAQDLALSMTAARPLHALRVQPQTIAKGVMRGSQSAWAQNSQAGACDAMAEIMDSRVQRQAQMATDMAQSKGMHEKIWAIRHDQELKPMFDKMEEGGEAAVMKYYSDPDFVRKIGEQLGETPALRTEAEALKTAFTMAQSKEMQKQVLSMLETDQELKPMFEEMETKGPMAQMKYYSDPEFLGKIGERLSKSPAFAKSARAFRNDLVTVRSEAQTAGIDNGADIGALGLRLIGGLMMVHNGLDKLADPAGFAKFVVEPYLHLPEALCLPATYAAAGIELVAPVLIILGVATRLASLGLLATMGGAIVFHLGKTGLEGFPFGVVQAHQYGFETATIYAAIYAYLALAGPGKFSVEKLSGGD